MLDLTIELKEFEKTLKNIPKGKSILIAAHNDVDGITSAFVFSRILDKLGFEYNNHYRTWIVDNAFRQKINENKQTAKDINRFDYIFFLDS
jgi:single-stranded DNA-specific DHH superfamily exonuclease